jgi:hypothetical protein
LYEFCLKSVKLTKSGVSIDLETATFAIAQLVKAKAKQNFGNAGAINNLLSQAKLNLQQRLSKLSRDKRKDVYIKEDFCPGGIMKISGNEEDIFSELVGCEDIIDKLQQ